jgi:Holliday junction resolvasome RuvABC endonuclease subunit
MRVVGLDLSLSATGVADEDGTRVIKVRSTGMIRLAELRDRVCSAAYGRADLVVIEGYSMGTVRQNSHAHALGELGGVIRLALWEAGMALVDVAPASLKRYACGKGNANKGQVLEAASKRSGLDFGGDDNRADAWWLRAMALDHYGQAPVAMPAAHRVALLAITWPALAAA